MTTVGYGDVYPTNALGYAAASVVIIGGIVITALPVAIIGSHFRLYHDYSLNRKRKAKKLRKKRRNSIIDT